MAASIDKNSSNSNPLRTFFKSAYHMLKKEDDCLPSLQDIVNITNARNEHYLGLKEIPVDNIIGSEGRYEDFNKNFFPKTKALQSRWSAIDKAMENNKGLPPINVFKIDDYYFVRDGNHRVSVAKSRKQRYIDAEVTEYEIDVPITKELTIKDRFKIQEHVNFLEATGLNRLGKGFDIKLTRPRSYRLLLNIIKLFTGYFETVTNKKLKPQEVAGLWYNQIFLPFAEGAYLDDALSKFPNRTTGDLYVWIQMNWAEVKDRLGDRLHYLAKPINENRILKNKDQNQYTFPTTISEKNPGYLRANIGLVITSTILNISRAGEIKIAIVKRKYHPFEDYWSLPVAMINETETRYDVANRCIRDSLNIRHNLHFVHYQTFDNVDRTPFGRMIAFGMLGIHYGNSMHMSAGGLAREIKLINLSDEIPLVYDHRDILNGALNYIYRIRNNFSFIKELFPDEIPLKYIRKLLREVRSYQHQQEQQTTKQGFL